MPTDMSQLEDMLRAAYSDTAATVRPDDISEHAPGAASPVRWRAAARTGRRRVTALAAAAAVLLIAITATVIPQVLQPGAAHHSQMAYVVTQHDLLIPVNLATGTTLKPIPLGVAGGVAGGVISLGAGVAISPDGTMVYVLTVRGQLVPVDVGTGKVYPAIRVGGVPQELLMTPNGRQAYVLEPPYGVVAVDLATRTALGLIKIHGASSFALTPNGKTLYVAGTTTSTTNPVLTAIDTATNTTVSTLTLSGPDLQSPLESHPAERCVTISITISSGLPPAPTRVCEPRGWGVRGASVTIAPGGKIVYVSYQSFNGRTYRSSGSIIPVDVASNNELKPVYVGAGALDFTISPDGQTGYLTELQAVVPIDLRTGGELPSIPLPAFQNGYDLTLAPGGKSLYLIQSTGSTVIPVDTARSTAVQPIRLGAARWYAEGGAFAPGSKTLYVFSYYGYPKGALVAGRMTPVDPASGAVGKPVDIPAGLDGIVFSP